VRRRNLQRNVVSSEVDEQEGNDGYASRRVSSLCKGSRETGDDDVTAQHDDARSEEKESSPKFVDHNSGGDSEEQIPDL
jgi:hypothetical protein